MRNLQLNIILDTHSIGKVVQNGDLRHFRSLIGIWVRQWGYMAANEALWAFMIIYDNQ